MPVTFNLQTNADGVATVSVDGRLLYSQYDPHKQARRWAEALSLAHNTRYVLLVGDLLGYAAAALRATRPELQIIAIKPAASIAVQAVEERYTVASDSPEQIRASVRAAIPYHALTGIEALSWPPAGTVLPQWSERTERAVIAAVSDRRSELATTAAFGRTWLHNALCRSLHHRTRSEIRLQTGDLLVVGAGSTLSSLAQPQFANAGVLAASSAVASLHAIDREPAIALHLDGGRWAQRYLHTIARVAPQALVVLGLKASRGPVREPVLIRSDWFGEAVAPDAADWPYVPEQPSVGLTLLDLRTRLGCTQPARTAGLDFCSYDLRSHAANHHNEQLVASSASRLAPGYHQLFERAAAGAKRLPTRWPDGTPAYTTAALDVFRAAFTHTAASAQPIAAVPELLRATEALEYVPSQPLQLERRVVQRPAARHRSEHARRQLAQWCDMLRQGEHSPLTDEITLHLAPVEFVRGNAEAARATAVRELTTLQSYVALRAERLG